MLTTNNSAGKNPEEMEMEMELIEGLDSGDLKYVKYLKVNSDFNNYINWNIDSHEKEEVFDLNMDLDGFHIRVSINHSSVKLGIKPFKRTAEGNYESTMELIKENIITGLKQASLIRRGAEIGLNPNDSKNIKVVLALVDWVRDKVVEMSKEASFGKDGDKIFLTLEAGNLAKSEYIRQVEQLLNR